MPNRPATVEEQIAFYRGRLENRHLDPLARHKYETALEALTSEHPYVTELTEIVERLDRPLAGAERAALEGRRDFLIRAAEHYREIDSKDARDRRKFYSCFLAESQPEPEAQAPTFSRDKQDELLSDFMMQGGHEANAARLFSPAELAAIEEAADRETMRDLVGEVIEGRAALDRIANQSRSASNLSEPSVYETTDSHGSTLLCIDFPIKTIPTNPK